MDRQHKAMVVKAIERRGKREVGDLIRDKFGCGYASSDCPVSMYNNDTDLDCIAYCREYPPPSFI